MLLKDMDPFIRIAATATLTVQVKADVFNELQTSDCRLFYILSGTGSMIIEGEIFELKQGCAILFQSGTKYVWQIDSIEGVHYIAINFDYTHNHTHIKKSFHPVHSNIFHLSDILENIVFSDCTELNAPIVIKDATPLEARMKLLTTEYFLGDDYCDELLSSTLKSIIISMVRTLNIKNNPYGNKGFILTQNIIQYIQHHYEEDISYETMSEIFHFNASHINRVFKKNTGKSLHAFLLDYRLNIAMELLRSQAAPINEIAAMVGFTDIPHFIKTFKKFTGVTPAKYRSSNE